MARLVKMSVGILNLRLHPHSPDIYLNYIADIYKKKNLKKVHGERYGIISSVDKAPSDEGTISGVITTFTKIETDGKWFDVEKLQDAGDEKLSSISIPPNIFPNRASYYFYFDSNNHKLYIQTYSNGKVFTIASAKKFFENITSDLDLIKTYGEAQITVVQSKAGLDSLFSIPVIKEIEITINKPNADIFADDLEEKVEAHLAESHSRTLKLTYEAEAGKSVVPTAEIRKVGEVALENGSVKVKGRDETGAVTKSSDDFPKILQDKFDPEVSSESAAFRQLIPVARQRIQR